MRNYITMMNLVKIILALSLGTTIYCSPYDDGKYAKKYSLMVKKYDDGKYYRPLDEGKYIPGDEGRYTYVYVQGLYPTDDGDYRYIHQVGPNGGFGSGGGIGGEGRSGGEGGNGPDGPGGPNGPDGFIKPNIIEYIGRRIYAERYPYLYKVIRALIDQYVSIDLLEPEGSANHFRRLSDKEIAFKCAKYFISQATNDTESATDSPPNQDEIEDQQIGSVYRYKGTRIQNLISTSENTKLKLDYEIVVKVTKVSE